MIPDVTPLQINAGSDANTACNSVTYPTPLTSTIVAGIATTLMCVSAAIMTKCWDLDENGWRIQFCDGSALGH
jgi:3-oxoacyl-[acyl-carrier-protein] synthase III